jgi:hypothetical protein
VTSIDYIQQRTVGRITLMIATVWLVSLLVSCFPLFGWKDDDWQKRIQVYQQCLISQDVGYQVTMSFLFIGISLPSKRKYIWGTDRCSQMKTKKAVPLATP